MFTMYFVHICSPLLPLTHQWSTLRFFSPTNFISPFKNYLSFHILNNPAFTFILHHSAKFPNMRENIWCVFVWDVPVLLNMTSFLLMMYITTHSLYIYFLLITYTNPATLAKTTPKWLLTFDVFWKILNWGQIFNYNIFWYGFFSPPHLLSKPIHLQIHKTFFSFSP